MMRMTRSVVQEMAQEHGLILVGPPGGYGIGRPMAGGGYHMVFWPSSGSLGEAIAYLRGYRDGVQDTERLRVDMERPV